MASKNRFLQDQLIGPNAVEQFIVAWARVGEGHCRGSSFTDDTIVYVKSKIGEVGGEEESVGDIYPGGEGDGELSICSEGWIEADVGNRRQGISASLVEGVRVVGKTLSGIDCA